MSVNNTKKRNTPSTTFVEIELDQLPSSLEDVLSNTELKEKFREFLKSRLAIESLLFFESIEYYGRFAMKQSVRNKVGLSLINKFVRMDGPYQVNLSERVSNALLSTVNFSETAFDAAKAEVYQLMSANFFEKFIRNLQGVDDESDAPKLSFDTRLTQLTNLTRTHSFEQLSTNLDLDSASLSNNSSTLSPKHSTNSLLHKTRTPSSSTSFSKVPSGVLLTNSPPTKSKNFRDQTNSQAKKASSPLKQNPSMQLFKKRVSKVRHFTFWSEIAKEEGLNFGGELQHSGADKDI